MVRSIVTLEDAQNDDVGVYQCRASNHAMRNKPGANIYKYWSIEESPILAVACDEVEGETVLRLPSVDSIHKYKS